MSSTGQVPLFSYTLRLNLALYGNVDCLRLRLSEDGGDFLQPHATDCQRYDTISTGTVPTNTGTNRTVLKFEQRLHRYRCRGISAVQYHQPGSQPRGTKCHLCFYICNRKNAPDLVEVDPKGDACTKQAVV